MIANAITLCRLLLTFGVIALLGIHRTLDIAMLATIAFIFALDALDGYIARKRNETDDTGALLDTLADRIVENTFWIYFTAMGLIPVWMPVIVMARGLITDSLQRFRQSPKRRWTHALSHSRISRGLYSTLKMLTFMSQKAAPFSKLQNKSAIGLLLPRLPSVSFAHSQSWCRLSKHCIMKVEDNLREFNEKHFDTTRRTN